MARLVTVIFVCYLGFLSVLSAKPPAWLYGQNACAVELRAVFLNAENAGNHINIEGKDDHKGLIHPPIVSYKALARIARILTENWTLPPPEIIVLSEVKDWNVIKTLIFMLGVDYDFTITKERDVRSANVAILTRTDIPIGRPSWSQEVATEDIPGRFGLRPSRNIPLVGWPERGFVLGGLHAPSPGNSTEGRVVWYSPVGNVIERLNWQAHMNTGSFGEAEDIYALLGGDGNMAPNVDTGELPIRTALFNRLRGNQRMVLVWEELPKSIQDKMVNYTYYWIPRSKKDEEAPNLLDIYAPTINLLQEGNSAGIHLLMNSTRILSYPFAGIIRMSPEGNPLLIPRHRERRRADIDDEGRPVEVKTDEYDLQGSSDHFGVEVTLVAMVPEPMADFYRENRQVKPLSSEPKLIDPRTGGVWTPEQELDDLYNGPEPGTLFWTPGGLMKIGDDGVSYTPLK